MTAKYVSTFIPVDSLLSMSVEHSFYPSLFPHHSLLSLGSLPFSSVHLCLRCLSMSAFRCLSLPSSLSFFYRSSYFTAPLPPLSTYPHRCKSTCTHASLSLTHNTQEYISSPDIPGQDQRTRTAHASLRCGRKGIALPQTPSREQGLREEAGHKTK